MLKPMPPKLKKGLVPLGEDDIEKIRKRIKLKKQLEELTPKPLPSIFEILQEQYKTPLKALKTVFGTVKSLISKREEPEVKKPMEFPVGEGVKLAPRQVLKLGLGPIRPEIITEEGKKQALLGEQFKKAEKEAEIVSPEVFLRKGLSLDWADIPFEPVTIHQKINYYAGKIGAYTALSYFGGQILGNILPKTALGVKEIAKLSPVKKVAYKLATEAVKHPWKVGYPLAIARGGGFGALVGAIEKEKPEITKAQQIFENAAGFAVFTAVLYPAGVVLKHFLSLPTSERTIAVNQAKATFKKYGIDPKNPKPRYYELMKKYHPDKPGGNAKIATEINSAYEIMSGKVYPKQFDTAGNMARKTSEKVAKREVARFVPKIKPPTIPVKPPVPTKPIVTPPPKAIIPKPTPPVLKAVTPDIIKPPFKGTEFARPPLKPMPPKGIRPEVKPIPKELESLAIKFAKQGKGAKEFVESQIGEMSITGPKAQRDWIDKKIELTDLYNQAVKEVKPEIKPAETLMQLQGLSEQIEKLDTEIEKQVEKFRKATGIVAPKEGAGIVKFKIAGEDTTTWSEKKMKREMARRAREAKAYAERELYEYDANFRALVDKRDALYQKELEQPGIDVEGIFDDEITKIDNQLNKKYDTISKVGGEKEAPPEIKGKVEGFIKAQKKEIVPEAEIKEKGLPTETPGGIPIEYVKPGYELTNKGRTAIGKKPIIEKAKAVTPKEKIEAKLFDTIGFLVPKDPNIPILGHIAIDGKVIKATDLETAIEYTLSEDTGIHKTIPVRFLKGKGIVDIAEIAKRTKGITLKDFPLIPEFKPKVGADISLSVEALKKAFSTLKKDDARAELSGLRFRSIPKGLEITGTDSYRLWRITVPNKISEKIDFILSYDTSKSLISVLNKVNPGIVKLNIGEDQISFEFNNFKITGRLIKETYPKVEEAIPKTIKNVFNVNRLELLDAVKESKPYVSAIQGIRLIPGKNNLVIKVENKEVGDFRKEIPAEISEGKKIDIEQDVAILMPIGSDEKLGIELNLNRNYLEDILKNSKGERITGGFNTAESPSVWLEPKEPEGVTILRDLGKPVYSPKHRYEDAEVIRDFITKVKKQPSRKRGMSFVKIALRDKGYLFTRKQIVEGPDDIADMFRELKNSDREKFMVVNLDKNNKIINTELISVGSVNAALIHPRETLKSAILSNAKKVYFIHNHPSGDVSPSDDDIVINIKLKLTAQNLGIESQGHLIMNTTTYGFLKPDKSFVENKMPIESQKLMKAKVVEVEQKLMKLFDKKLLSPGEVSMFVNPILGDIPTILSVNLDTRNRINGINIIGFSLKNPDQLAKTVIKNAAINNAPGVILSTNIDLLNDTNIKAFQDIEDKMKIASIDLVDVVDTKAFSLVEKKYIGKGRTEISTIKEEIGEYKLGSREKELLERLEKGEELSEKDLEFLKEKGLIKIKAPKVKKPKWKGPGFITEERARMVQQVIESKRIDKETVAILRNSFVGHKRTRIEELTEAQGVKLYETLLKAGPREIMEIKREKRLVSKEVLEAMKDFVPPSILEKEAVRTGDIAKFIDEKEVNYIISLLRPIRNVLRGTPILDKTYNTISTAEEDTMRDLKKWHKEYKELYRLARKENKDLDLAVFDYIEQGIETTPNVTKLARFLEKFYADSIPVMKPLKLRKGYITHTKPSFMEKVRLTDQEKELVRRFQAGEKLSDVDLEALAKTENKGLRTALKDIILPIKFEGDIDPGIIANLDYILSKEKFNPYKLPRDDRNAYSRKLVKALDGYVRLYFWKKNFDPVMPGIIKTRSFLPGTTQTYITKYLQNVKGRPLDYRWGNRAHQVSNALTRYEYLRLLALNTGSATVNVMGGMLNNFAEMPLADFLRGWERLGTKQGRAILKEFGFTQQSMWLEPVGGFIQNLTRAERALFIFMQTGEFFLRGIPGLSQIPANEFKSGELSFETRALARRRIGKTQGLYGKTESPLIVRTVIGRPAFQFKLWMVTEMELWADWTREALVNFKNNPTLLDKTIKNPGVVKWIKFLMLAIPLFLWGQKKLKEQMKDYALIFASIWGMLVRPNEFPVGRDLVLVSELLWRIINGELREAGDIIKNQWVRHLPAGVEAERIKNFLDVMDKGATFYEGRMKEEMTEIEALKRVLLGMQTKEAQQMKDLQQRLNDLLAGEYQVWDNYFGVRRVKSKHQEKKEDIIGYIEKNHIKNYDAFIKDPVGLLMLAEWNSYARDELDKIILEGDIKMITSEHDSLLKKVTFQREDIDRWFETIKYKKSVPVLERIMGIKEKR